MDSTLADFRIEHDNVVLLSFANGSSYRVNPSDLERHLSQHDLTRVRRALQLRTRFMRSVLPPSAMIILLASVIGMGGYDVHQISSDMQAANRSHTVTHQSTVPAPTPASNQTDQASHPVSAPPSPSGPASALPQANANGRAIVPMALKAVPKAAKADSVPSEHSGAPLAPSIVPTPINNLVQPILQPVTKPLTKALPITSRLLPPGL